MSSAPLVEILARYVPAIVVDRVRRGAGAANEPTSERFGAAVLFADVSGFTPLAEELARRGPAGAEELTRVLNSYFGRLVDTVRAHGGDVLKFAGDALLAAWLVDEADEVALARSAHRSACCALLVQEELCAWRAPGEVTLSLRLALGAGTVAIAEIGGVFGRWELLIAGRPLEQVAAAGALAAPGEVVLAREAWGHVERVARGDAIGGAAGAVRLRAIEPFARAAADAGPAPRADMPALRADMEGALRAHIPGAILHRLAAGQSEWLGELRRLTVLFVHLSDLVHRTVLERAQEVMSALQGAIYRFEGSINKLSVDDKGTTLIAALGLPPLAHENDAARGVRAALAVRDVLVRLGSPCALGVTTGRVFCGAVGSESRREYTILGDVVNLAARLMQGAKGSILCDEATFQATRAEIEYGAQEMLQVKGKSAPVSVHRALRERAAAPGERASARTGELIGRAPEREQLAGVIERLDARVGAAVLIEGEAGIGKSCLLDDLLAVARARGVRVLRGAADAIEVATPYRAWQAVLTELLGLEGVREASARRERALGELAGDAELERLAPLLNDLVALALPESELCAQMEGEVRAENTRALLVRLFVRAARGAPLVVALENAQWLDSASWALAARLQRENAALVLALALRPLAGAAPAGHDELARAALHLHLCALTPEESLALVARSLGVARLPPSVAALIRERAEGHPLFAEALGRALVDAGWISVEHGECRLSAAAPDLATVDLPNTIEGLITARIDRLAPAQQLTLKVASVIGRRFSLACLQSVHPVEGDRERLPAQLEALLAPDLLVRELLVPDLPVPEHGDERSYSFAHSVTKDVAYDLLLYSQRKELHRRVARWYEDEHAGRALPDALLAHHFARAGMDAEAVDCLERAAEHALRTHANEEVEDFLDEAAERDLYLHPPSGALRRAHWDRLRGEALRALGRHEEARVSLERALARLGYAPPAHPLRLGLATLGQALQRLLPPALRARARTGAEQRAMLEAAIACERLGLVYYLTGAQGGLVYAALRATSLAEAVGEATPVLAMSYASLAAVLGAVPLSAAAERAAARALEVARALDHVPTWTWVLLAVGVSEGAAGRLESAEERCRRGLALAQELGDRRRIEELASTLATVLVIRGRAAESERVFRAALASAQARGDAQARGWSLFGVASTLLPQGRADELGRLLDEAAPFLAERGPELDPVTLLFAMGLELALVLAGQRAGDAPQLLERALAHEQRIGRPNQFHALLAYHYVADAALILCCCAAAGVERARAARRARVAVRALEAYARIFAVGRAHALSARAREAELAGHARRAARARRRSAAWAERLGLE